MYPVARALGAMRSWGEGVAHLGQRDVLRAAGASMFVTFDISY